MGFQGKAGLGWVLWGQGGEWRGGEVASGFRRGHPAWVTGTLGSETSITTGGPKRSPRPDNQDPKRRPKPKGASLSSLVPWISAQAQGIRPGLHLPGSFFPLPPTLLSCHLV